MKRVTKVLVFFALCLLVGCGREKPGKVLRADSKDLKHTIITANLEEKIVPGKNIIYCSTFQLAWNELRDNIVKEDIRLDGDPPLVAVLNKKLATKDDISPDSYLAMVGFGKDGILEKVNNSLRSKFGDAAPTVTEPLGPEDILAYAYLLKDLKFATPFESLKEPVEFQSSLCTSNVRAFGIKEFNPGKRKHQKLAEEVSILGYADEGAEFVVGLSSKSPKDEIVLAKVKPAETLLETFRSVHSAAERRESWDLDHDDTLQVPKLDFDLRHSYSELIQKSLRNEGFQGYFITKAQQDIRFRLNERGAMLKSEARLKVESKERPRRLVFDAPFLLYLREKQGKFPYLAIWVDNAEILLKK
jgi:hypothetical protein